MCFFEDNHCLIKDATRQDLFKVKMRGKSFSLDPFQEEQTVFSKKRKYCRVMAQEAWSRAS